MTTIFLRTLIVAAIGLAGCDTGILNAGSQAGSDVATVGDADSQTYTCPMHPHYISTDPNGACPICGMDLVPVSGGSSSSNQDRGDILYFKHPMGKPVTSPVPKKDEMGMDYIPVYENEVAGTGVSVAPDMIQTMGIRSVPVRVMDFSETLRAFGTVETNERLENVSVSRLEGWIEDLTIRAEGDTVRPGALLYRIYSPDLIAAQKDYINSLRIGNESRIAAVRQRLRSIGMQTSTIERLTQNRVVVERVPVYAEAGGTVAELQVREGDYVKPGTPILRLQSYAGVWVMASVPESDLPKIDTGMTARLDFPSAPAAPAEGVIDYIYPTIDARTRTAKLRIEVDNAAGYLRPGAYADITLDLDGEARLAVPTEAVLRDSRGDHVILALGEGRFSSRMVMTGERANGLTEIVSGLERGEAVVASGQFMLDSEVNLREGLSKLDSVAGSSVGPETPLSELPIDATALAEIDHFVDMALYFHEALIDGYKIDPFFIDPALSRVDSLRQRFANTQLVPILNKAETALRTAKVEREGEPLRVPLAQLTQALEPWLLEGAPSHYRELGVTLFQETETKRLWLQEGQNASNPYSDSEAKALVWPDPMTGMGMKISPENVISDSHSGHE